MRALLRLPASHPHLAEFVTTNDRLVELDFLGVETPKIQLLWVEDIGPEHHRFYVGCSRDYVAQWLERRWG